MKSTFRTLQKDHDYFRLMLDELARMIVACRSGAEPEWSLLDHLVNTLCHYPEQHHHPLEDEFLELLKSRHWISDLIIDSLHRDHVRLNHLGALAQKGLSPSNRHTDKAHLAQIWTDVDNFVSAYQDHIKTEEELVFPMMEKLINETGTDFSSTGGHLSQHAVTQKCPVSAPVSNTYH